MATQPDSPRRTLQEIAAAIRAVAAQGTVQGELLTSLAITVESGNVRRGNARGLFHIQRSPNGVTVTCEHPEQAAWVDTACRAIKINVFTPNLRPLERELHLP
jgi:hypothetical protein